MIKLKDYQFNRVISSLGNILLNYNVYFEVLNEKFIKDRFYFISYHHIGELYVVLYKLSETIEKFWQAKFLDVGCGIGNIVMLAREVGFNAYGLEIDKELCEIAQKILNIKRRREKWRTYVYRRDILKFNSYSKYDIIYFYCPFSNTYLEYKLEAKIADLAKIGAYIIPLCAVGGRTLFESKSFEKVVEDTSSNIFVYKKVSKIDQLPSCLFLKKCDTNCKKKWYKCNKYDLMANKRR